MTDNQITCPGCGEPAAPGIKFCAKCGAAIPEQPPELEPEPKANFCVSCGKSVEPGTTFCPGCGAKIGEAPSAGGGKEVSFVLPEGITLPNRFEITPGPILYAGGAAVLLTFISLFMPWTQYDLGWFGSASTSVGCGWQFIFLLLLLVGASQLVLKPAIHWIFLGVGALGFLLCFPASGSFFGTAAIGFYFGLVGQIAWLATFGLAHMEQNK